MRSTSSLKLNYAHILITNYSNEARTEPKGRISEIPLEGIELDTPVDGLGSLSPEIDTPIAIHKRKCTIRVPKRFRDDSESSLAEAKPPPRNSFNSLFLSQLQEEGSSLQDDVDLSFYYRKEAATKSNDWKERVPVNMKDPLSMEEAMDSGFLG